MYANKLIDGIIKEPLGGAQNDPAAIASTLKQQIVSDLETLTKKDIKKVVSERIDKFSSMGVVNEH
ncbi:Acetyl-coenzyme A carboxylase carboxyl transferase subunit alpha [compost metagenome]